MLITGAHWGSEKKHYSLYSAKWGARMSMMFLRHWIWLLEMEWQILRELLSCGSHGGFLATHLIGQAPDRFATGIARNPVCNVSSMVGITDIPDWCYVEAFGKVGLSNYSEAPSVEDLSVLYQISPIAHISKVNVPTLFLLGAQDRRVPVSNGLQYVQALRARGQEVKVIVFPEDVHAIDKPQSDFESFMNIGVWLKRFIQ
jgi:acylaminoacyl-peptidase